MAAPIVSAARAAPIAWSALVAASQQPSRFAMAITRRTAEQTALYAGWKAQVAAKAAEDPSIGYGIEAAFIGKLTGSWRPLSPGSTCLVSLLPNDFPYHVEPGVAHAVLWLERGEGLSQEEALAAATVLAADGTGRPRMRDGPRRGRRHPRQPGRQRLRGRQRREGQPDRRGHWEPGPITRTAASRVHRPVTAHLSWAARAAGAPRVSRPPPKFRQ